MKKTKDRNDRRAYGRLIWKNEEKSRGKRGVERVGAKDLPDGRILMMMMMILQV